MILTERDVIIDVETRNKQELTGKKAVGTYKYVYDSSCELVLLSFTYGNLPNEPEYIYTYDLTKGDVIPQWFIDILSNPYYIKHAHNVAFEIGVLHNTLGVEPRIEQWIDDMALVAFCGLPLGLKDSSGTLGHKWGKLTYGDSLVKHYCTLNKNGVYNDQTSVCKVYETDPTTGKKKREPIYLGWEHFVWYNKVDVLAEKENILSLPECPELTQEGIERDTFIMDYYINSRGLYINEDLARKADMLCDREDQEMIENFRLNYPDVKIKNPNSGDEVKKWLKERGYNVDKLTKDDYEPYLKMTERDEISQIVLNVKKNLSLTSATKFEKFLLTAIGNRIYGTLQYYAANRTGRWGGRGAQPQNLKRNDMDFELLEFLRNCVLRGDYTTIKQVFGSVKENIIELGRTVIEPDKDHVFMPSDFSAIEARVTAWLAGEQWRLDVFNTHGKIYEASASMMFKVPLESIKKGSIERLKGKYAELALGFSGWVGAFYRFGADKFMTESEMTETANAWRKTNKHIVAMWDDIEDTAVRAVTDFGNPYSTKFGVIYQGVEYNGRYWLTCKLLSGRRLFYYNPRLIKGRGGKQSITYRRNANDQDTWRGMLTENVVQAIARDLLVYKMWYIWKVYGLLPHLHVHDELVYQFHKDVAEQWKPILNGIMAMEVDWAKGLPLKGDTSIIPFYMKPED